MTGGLSLALDVSDRSQEDGTPPSRSGAVDAVTDATRALARSVEPVTARLAVCEGARRVAGAPVAALFEPTRDGDGAGRRARRRAPISAAVELAAHRRQRDAPRAFTTAEDVFVVLDDGDGEADREFLRRARAHGRCCGIRWSATGPRRRAGDRVAARRSTGSRCSTSALIDLLAAEAAVAIGRADLLGQLEHLARTDALTGLPNRRFWEQQLPRRAGPRRARGSAGVRRDARPRPLQGLQRPPRPPGRRPPAGRGGGRLARRAAALRRPRPLRRRGVQPDPARLRSRRPASRSSSACGATRRTTRRARRASPSGTATSRPRPGRPRRRRAVRRPSAPGGTGSIAAS